VDIFNTSS